jgi:cell volume regulation protein A
MLTAIIVGYAAYYVLDFSLLEAMLLAAIISSTDAAAVFSILRSKQISLKGDLRPLLELESGSNDPMAIFLTTSLIALITGAIASPTTLISMFAQQMALGAVFGYMMGRGMAVIVNRIRLDYRGLYPLLTISLVLLTYALTAALGGNGFLAVYIAGLSLGSHSFIHKRSLIDDHDSMAWLMQIVLFITLGLQVFPSQLGPQIGAGLMISLFLILLARPISIFLVLWPFRFNLRSKLFISWVGLRGAVPIVFATYPLTMGLPHANIIFNLVFFITVTSVSIQGTTVPLAAKILKLSIPGDTRKKTILDRELADKVRSLLDEITISPEFPCVGKPIVDLKLPHNVLVVMIKRERQFLIPDGSTVLQAGDKMMIMADDKESIQRFYSCLNPNAAPTATS